MTEPETIPNPWRVIVRCKICGLVGEVGVLRLGRNSGDQTIGIAFWIAERCPPCSPPQGAASQAE